MADEQGAVERFVLIGHPVSHSVSPAIHGAAYEILGRAGQYCLVDASSAAEVREVIERIASGELVGANVTVPWKQLALQCADRVDSSAADVGAANVLSRDAEGKIVAYNTDASALAEELRAAKEALGPVSRNAALVLGTGGAALAAVVSCQRAGFDPVYVTGRRFVAGTSSDPFPLATEWRRLGARMVLWPTASGDVAPRPADVAVWGEILPELAAVVQATSAGMKNTAGGTELAELIPWAELEPLVAYDLVYNPPQTPFLRLAEEHGHQARGGLGMLVGQAAQAIEIWWGTKPPSAPLSRAAEQALGLLRVNS